MTTRKLAATVTILGVIILAVVFLVVIPNLQCSKKRVNRPDSLGTGTKVTIRQNYPPGKYTMTQTQEQAQVIKSDGQKQNVSMSVLVVMGMDVSEPDEKGLKSIAMSFQRFKIDSNGVKVDTDDMPPKPKKVTPGPAAFPDPTRRSSQKEMIENIYRELLKVKLIIKIGPEGNILKVTGFDDVWERVVETEPATASFIDVFKKSFGDDKIAELMGLQDKFLPPQPVGVGAIWHPNVSMEIPIVGTMTYDAECELIELKDTPEGQVAKIDIVADITSDSGSDMSVGNASVRIDKLEMDHKQTIEINVQTGLITKQILKQEGEIKMTVFAPNSKESKAVSELSQDTTITVERAK